MIDYEKLMEYINKIESLAPFDGKSDYCMGYRACLMHIKKALKGENPFEIKFNNQIISMAKNND